MMLVYGRRTSQQAKLLLQPRPSIDERRWLLPEIPPFCENESRISCYKQRISPFRRPRVGTAECCARTSWIMRAAQRQRCVHRCMLSRRHSGA
jgi:hypothetical protein